MTPFRKENLYMWQIEPEGKFEMTLVFIGAVGMFVCLVALVSLFN